MANPLNIHPHALSPEEEAQTNLLAANVLNALKALEEPALSPDESSAKNATNSADFISLFAASLSSGNENELEIRFEETETAVLAENAEQAENIAEPCECMCSATDFEKVPFHSSFNSPAPASAALCRLNPAQPTHPIPHSANPADINIRTETAELSEFAEEVLMPDAHQEPTSLSAYDMRYLFKRIQADEQQRSHTLNAAMQTAPPSPALHSRNSHSKPSCLARCFARAAIFFKRKKS